MPPKVRDLVAQLERAGFVDRGGRGSHRIRTFNAHPRVSAGEGSSHEPCGGHHGATALDIGFDIMSIKALIWLGDSLDRVRMFATEGRQEMGFELWEIQQGKEPSDSKPMASVGLEKQSRKTAKSDLDLARTRFKALVQERKRK